MSSDFIWSQSEHSFSLLVNSLDTFWTHTPADLFAVLTDYIQTLDV